MSDYDPNYVPTHAYFLLVVKVIVHDENNNILLIQRSTKTPRPHGWDFPGGGVDEGEDPIAAAIRETLEETGLEISAPKLLTTYSGHISAGNYLAFGYSAQVNSKDIQLSWEHEAYRWLTIDEAQQLELPELHRTILKVFEHTIPKP